MRNWPFAKLQLFPVRFIKTCQPLRYDLGLLTCQGLYRRTCNIVQVLGGIEAGTLSDGGRAATGHRKIREQCGTVVPVGQTALLELSVASTVWKIFPRGLRFCFPRLAARLWLGVWRFPHRCSSRRIARSAKCGGWKGPAEIRACAAAGRFVLTPLACMTRRAALARSEDSSQLP